MPARTTDKSPKQLSVNLHLGPLLRVKLHLGPLLRVKLHLGPLLLVKLHLGPSLQANHHFRFVLGGPASLSLKG
jgi:hypothetical protein